MNTQDTLKAMEAAINQHDGDEFDLMRGFIHLMAKEGVRRWRVLEARVDSLAEVPHPTSQDDPQAGQRHG